MSKTEQQPFINEVQRLRLLHAMEFPQYKFVPRKRSKVTRKKLDKQPHLLPKEVSGVCSQ